MTTPKLAKAKAPPARPAKARRIRPRRVSEGELSETERWLLGFDRSVHQHESDVDPREWRLLTAQQLEWKKVAWADDGADLTPEAILGLTLRIQEWLARGAPQLSSPEARTALRRVHRLVTDTGTGRNEVLAVLDRAVRRDPRDREGLVRLGLRKLLGEAKEASVSDETVRAALVAWTPVARGGVSPPKWKLITEILHQLGFPVVDADSVARDWRAWQRRKTPDRADPPPPRMSETTPEQEIPAERTADFAPGSFSCSDTKTTAD